MVDLRTALEAAINGGGYLDAAEAEEVARQALVAVKQRDQLLEAVQRAITKLNAPARNQEPGAVATYLQGVVAAIGRGEG